MIKKPNQLFIGKDITRTVALAVGEDFTVVSAGIVEGEIVALDKDMKVLAANATSATSDTIYIAEGTSRTLAYNNEAGTALTGRHILLSDPIAHKLVRKVTLSPYTAKAEATATIAAITGTIVAGTEYVLRIVYGDMEEHPGQFTQTYRYVAKTGDTSQLVFNGLRARIAKHTGTRVVASGTTTLILTARPVPGSTSSLNNIDEFKMVSFDTVVLNLVDNTGNWAPVGGAAVTVVAPVYGNGNWEQIRDIEKHALGYRGVTNRTHFPVITPDFRTDRSASYNTLVIEYDAAYRSPDNSYEKFTSKRVILALATTDDDDAVAATGQVLIVANTLASWLGITQDVYTVAT